MAEVKATEYGKASQNTRTKEAGSKQLPPTTHNLRAADGYADSKGYVPGVFIREAENQFGGLSLKINIPEGKTVTLTSGTYYVNPRKPIDA